MESVLSWTVSFFCTFSFGLGCILMSEMFLSKSTSGTFRPCFSFSCTSWEERYTMAVTDTGLRVSSLEVGCQCISTSLSPYTRDVVLTTVSFSYRMMSCAKASGRLPGATFWLLQCHMNLSPARVAVSASQVIMSRLCSTSDVRVACCMPFHTLAVSPCCVRWAYLLEWSYSPLLLPEDPLIASTFSHTLAHMRAICSEWAL